MGGVEKGIWSGQFVLPEWLARMTEVLTYQKQHLHTVFHFGLQLWEWGERNVWQGKKYHSLVFFFFPSASLASVYLAAALKCFHENSAAEQVGVVAPGVGTAKHGEDTTQGGFFVVVISACAAYKQLPGSHCI